MEKSAAEQCKPYFQQIIDEFKILQDEIEQLKREKEQLKEERDQKEHLANNILLDLNKAIERYKYLTGAKFDQEMCRLEAAAQRYKSQ